MAITDCKPLPTLRPEDVIRFWSKVDKKSPDECWPWKGTGSSNGYGHFSYKHKPLAATRVMWRLHHGQDPYPLFMCHHCDNPTCVNPSHLFLGTQKDNIADRDAKGRVCRGENQFASKLTERTVFLIRSIYGERRQPYAEQRDRLRKGAYAPITQKELAKLFSIGRSTLMSVLNRKTWKHI